MFTVGMYDCAGGGGKEDRVGTPCLSKAAAVAGPAQITTVRPG